jgi:copper chaperone CopZ
MLSSNSVRTTLPLTTPGCGGGAALTVERELASVPGVTRVYVNPLTEMAYVEYDAARCGDAELTAALRRAGYGGNTR